MPTVYKEVNVEVEVEVDLDEFDTDELIDELRERGELSLSYFDTDELIEELDRRGETASDILQENTEFQKAIDYYKRGQLSEAMVYLERAVPEFYGLGAKLK